MNDVQIRIVSGLILTLILLSGVSASSIPPSEIEGGESPLIRKNAQGEVVVHDPIHKFRIRLPAPYWECKSPGQISRERGGGGGLSCSSGSQVPSSLLLVVRNKDAQAVASLELQKDRFRMRGKPDLEEYVKKRQNKMMKQGGAFNVEESEYTQEKGMIIHRATYSATQNKGRQKYLLVDYFVRPRGQQARVYRLACVATPDAFERLKKDYESIINSFEYTGKLADSFFTPDASAGELPSVEKEGGGSGSWGGQYSGMIIAMGIVFLLYMFFRRRSQ